jgi:4a-hydroxytetrahydrobiopterin dehydratase
MTALADRRCAPCEGGVEPLAPDEARRQLTSLNPGWRLDPDARHIAREYRFSNFFRVMSFTNAIAHIANEEDHHPDLELGYNYLRVRYTTHSIRGLSENDFICAAKIDRL